MITGPFSIAMFDYQRVFVLVPQSCEPSLELVQHVQAASSELCCGIDEIVNLSTCEDAGFGENYSSWFQTISEAQSTE